MIRLRAHSIALPIFLLVFGAIVAATAVTFAVTFGGPPPFARPIELAEVAAALRGAPPRGPGPRTVAVTTGAAPRPDGGQRRAPAIDAALAHAIGTAPDRVVGFYRTPRLGDGHELRGAFTVGWQAPEGWRVARVRGDRAFVRWLGLTLAAMAAALAVLSAIAWGVARAISRPLAALATAAARARPGTAAPPPPGEGPREVVALGAAIASMQARLAAHAGNRTAMLAAIAHDLGTPLSRIAFWIEQLPEPGRTRGAADIDEMRAMLGDVLRFARDERTAAPVRIDLGSVLDALVDDLAVAGAPVSLAPGDRVLVAGDAAALRRLFANLADNAVRYGGRAAIGWAVAGGEAVVTVDDDGAGFNPALGERLFEPFVRGDPSRNRETGGTGLGLAIVRSIAEAHGGTVRLARAPGGGGRVEVRLPLA